MGRSLNRRRTKSAGRAERMEGCVESAGQAESMESYAGGGGWVEELEVAGVPKGQGEAEVGLGGGGGGGGWAKEIQSSAEAKSVPKKSKISKLRNGKEAMSQRALAAEVR